MSAFAIYLKHPARPTEDLWRIVLRRDIVRDLPVSDKFRDLYGHNRGNSRFWDQYVDGAPVPWSADRIAYHTVWSYWQHEDPGHHPFTNAIRFHWQVLGAGRGGRIIDSGMVENPFGRTDVDETQGLAPYPYETGPYPIERVDRSLAGPHIVELIHMRNRASGSYQLLHRFVLPHVSQSSGQAAPTRWYYQGSGTWIGVSDEFGQPVTRLILTANHPAYTFRVQGVPTEFASTVGDVAGTINDVWAGLPVAEVPSDEEPAPDLPPPADPTPPGEVLLQWIDTDGRLIEIVRR
jgi:hypothetical protein